jgi:hypothetical protein
MRKFRTFTVVLVSCVRLCYFREMSALIFFIFGSLGRFSSSAMATTIPDYFNIGVMFPMQKNNIPVKSILNFAAM